MADICACNDSRCPSRTLCYRFTCEKDEYRQAYFAKSPRKPHAMRCEEFWDNSGTPDPTDYTVNEPPMCRCNLFGMKHKRTESCEVFEVITQPQLRKKYNRRGIKQPKIQPKGCKIGKSYPKGGKK